MDETDDDDFGGFEVADADSEPLAVSTENSSVSNVEVAGPEVSSIPWLAASIQASTNEVTILDWGTKPATAPVPAISESSAGLTSAVSDDTAAPQPSVAVPETKSAMVEMDADPVSTEVKDLTSQLELALEEKQKYRSETVELKLGNEEHSRHLQRLRSELSDQEKRYEQTQAKHKTELEEMKGANSQALALVVEEYKEAVKLSILEQQKSCTQIFTEQLEKEATKLHTVFDEQTTALQLWKSEFTEEMNKKRELMLLQLQGEVEEEKQSLREKYADELTLSKEQLSLVRSEALQDVQTQLVAKISELELKCKDIVGQVSEELKESVKSQHKDVRDQERTVSMDYWEKHSTEMMIKLQESLDSSIQSHRKSMDAYVSQRIQADRSSQQKHLSAINVYLEAASKHISVINDDNTAKVDDTVTESGDTIAKTDDTLS